MQRVAWVEQVEKSDKHPDGVASHDGSVLGCVVKKGTTYLVVHCFDGLVREVAIDLIHP